MLDNKMWEIISQIAIFIFGVSSIVLIARKNKWGFVFGLIAQPFWYITSYMNKQWGIFLVSFVYTISWIYGIYQWFYKDNGHKEKESSTEKNSKTNKADKSSSKKNKSSIKSKSKKR